MKLMNVKATREYLDIDELLKDHDVLEGDWIRVNSREAMMFEDAVEYYSLTKYVTYMELDYEDGQIVNYRGKTPDTNTVQDDDDEDTEDASLENVFENERNANLAKMRVLVDQIEKQGFDNLSDVAKEEAKEYINAFLNQRGLVMDVGAEKQAMREALRYEEDFVTFMKYGEITR